MMFVLYFLSAKKLTKNLRKNDSLSAIEIVVTVTRTYYKSVGESRMLLLRRGMNTN
jgi:hypothetical protein